MLLQSSRMMLQCLRKENVTEMLQTLVSSLRQSIEVVEEIAGQLLDQNALMTIGEGLIRLLDKSHERIRKREADAKASEDWDEEAEAMMRGDNQEEDELNFTVSQCIGALIKSHRDKFLPVFNQLVPHILRMLRAVNMPASRKVACYIFDDIVEFLGPLSLQYFPAFLPPMIECVVHDDAELAQAAAYGVGLCAQHGRDTFAPFVDEAARRLALALQHPQAKDPIRDTTTDNVVAVRTEPLPHCCLRRSSLSCGCAVGCCAVACCVVAVCAVRCTLCAVVQALGKLAHAYKRGEFLGVWLQNLPLRADASEAAYVYARLCEYIESNNPAVLGKNHANLPKIVSVLADVMGGDMLDREPELQRRIEAILLQIKRLPAAAMQQLLATYTPEVRQNVISMFSALQAANPQANANANGPAGGGGGGGAPPAGPSAGK
jgi:importin-5